MLPLKKTILCVDADAIELAKHKRLLQSERYDVLTAANGDRALELFFACFVDAVVIGEHLEGIDEGTLCARMKQTKPHVPIMLLSAYGAVSDPALRHIDAFVYRGRPETAFLASLDRMLNLSSGFFSRWLDNWKFRVASLQPEPKHKKTS